LVITATLCHVIKGNRLLLKKATRGISKGKWNAPGGKLDSKEAPFDNAKREVLEETGLKVIRLTYHGIVEYFMGGKTSLHTKVYLFSTRNFQGKYQSTAEGKLRWFHRDKLPFGRMWPDDRYWIHLMLLGDRFNAKFYFDRRNVKVINYQIASRLRKSENLTNSHSVRRVRTHAALLVHS
jgi:8-oxo-dGTP pyrophosphatase MutT (NUDIX family)